METQEIISLVLGILTMLFGGLNILQLLTFRAYKRQRNAEADKTEIDALRAIIDTNTAEIGRLNQRIADGDRLALEAANRYTALYDKYVALREEFNEYKLNHK